MIRQWMLILFCLLLPLASAAAEPVYLTAMRIQPGLQSTRIIFTLTRQTYGRVKYLPNPHRLLVDFANTQHKFNIKNARLAGANVTTIHAESIAGNVLRFNFGLSEKVRWTTQFMPIKNANRVTFQIDIISISKGKAKPVQQSNKTQAGQKRLFTVVIDPGHGGKDTGAIGKNGTKEKEVVLAVSKKLAQLINQSSTMRAILTRNGDYYLRLRERMKLARKKEADVFVAIHADAFYHVNARGSSVFAVSQRAASSEAARWLAQQDNHAELGGVALNALQDQSMVLRSVLIDLAQTATIQDSIDLGNQMLGSLSSVSPLHYKRVEQAPFLVLKSPDIPSILIETGFISNPQEEQRLSNPDYQQKLAQAIYQGLVKYRGR